MPDNQGSAGVRLQIIDNSTFTVPVTPLTVGAVVGYSTKGPFNTIIPLSSNADVNTILGSSGFQNPKYNHSLLASRGLLLGGGGAEFVRVFTETPDLSVDKGALKSDAWLVSYDKSPDSDNFSTEFFAATNNVAGSPVMDLDGNKLGDATHSDGYAEYGNREIYDISTVVSTREARDFSLDSAFNDTIIPLFSIIPVDPSSTVRGNNTSSDSLNVKTAANGTYLAGAADTIDYDEHTITSGDTVSLSGYTFVFGSGTGAQIGVVVGDTTEASLILLKAAILNESISCIDSVDVTASRMVINYMGFDKGPVAVSEGSATVSSSSDSSTSYDNVLVDDTFGIEFEGMGLATELSFVDSNGNYVKKYQLSDDGSTVARSYIKVGLTFDGTDIDFSGTLMPLVVDDENLYIVEQTLDYADQFAFIVNDNDALDDNISEGFIDLGTTIVDGVLTADFTQYAYDASASDDTTASLWTGSSGLDTFIWHYDPRRNQDSAGIAAAYELFLDKDISDVAFFVAAGMNIKNYGKKNRETLDMAVVNSVLDVCDKRKDCVAFFDAPDYKSVATVIHKVQGLAGLSTEMARWGGIWDGREMMSDIFYTKLTIELPKTVGVGNRIMSNTRGGAWWIPPAGVENGGINGLFSNGQKYQRAFNYAGDKTSDIAQLYNNYINPTRVTAAGQIYDGQKTMLRKKSAFQRIHVSLLVAGINKRFSQILDKKTFLLNTRELREEIQSTLQTELNGIKSASPAGITSGTVICDTSNNTTSIIQQRKLIVDIIDFSATEAAEFITLRTTVIQSGEGNDVSTVII